MDPWTKLNERRLALVVKLEAKGLSEAEARELKGLYELLSVYAKHTNQSSPLQKMLRAGGVN